MFASTCSNYGRMADPTVPINEDGELRPVSLYAEQKVGMEQLLLGAAQRRCDPTCLRFATVYGVGPRMRFDLTVNEFTRDLWADRELEVFGEQFWRPYVHVRDAAPRRAHGAGGADEEVGGEVFNAGDSRRELPQARPRRGDPASRPTRRGVLRAARRGPARLQGQLRQDRATLGFETLMTVPDGIGRDHRGARGRRARRSVRH